MHKTSSGGDATQLSMGPVQEESDSDMEAMPDPPQWKQVLSKEVVRKMKPKEVKRQDVINGEWKNDLSIIVSY